MIVGSHQDTIQLRGALHRNEWLTIKALARMLLQQYPSGILIDCTELTDVSADGTKTFLEAMRDIQREGARIVVVNLPESVLQMVRSVPGVRSQLPLAKSIAEARASLRLGERKASADPDGPTPDRSIIVPLIEGLDIEYAVTVAGRLSRDTKIPITLAALLAIARNLPLGTPMPQEESVAGQMLDQAEQTARKQGLTPVLHMERVRDIEEGLIQLLKSSRATHVIVGIAADRVGDDTVLHFMDLLLHRAPCNVVIARHAPDEDHPLIGAAGQGRGASSQE